MHYVDFETAKAAWIKRCKRINYEKLYFIMEFYNNENIECLKVFDELKFPRKMAITHKFYSGIKCQYVVDCYNDEDEPIGNLFAYNGFFGNRNYDKFDFIEFLNN